MIGDNMKCSNCKAEVDSNIEFCPYCGRKIDIKVNETKYKIMLLLLLFFFPIGIIYYCFNRKEDYRMKKAFRIIVIIYFLPFMVSIAFFALSILDGFKNGGEMTPENTECSYYCANESYRVIGNTCYCADGKSKKLDDSIEDEPSKEEIIDEPKNEEKIEASIVKSDNFDTEKWLNEVKSKNVIINVIASSTCPHCHNFNPVIEKVATENNVKLYFIEVDKLDGEKFNTYINSIEIPGYKGYVPYTFITYDGKVVSENLGELDSSDTDILVKNVLKQYK